jgi:hypothetical protein
VYKTKWLQFAAVGALGISAFGQGHSHLLPAGSKVNPKGLSQGAKMWWYGPQPATGTLVRKPTATSTYPNVDAANVNEDLAGGQAETAIAAYSLTVMAAWNDSTGFFVLPTTNPLASITGVGLSRDGGVTFTDLGGCQTTIQTSSGSAIRVWSPWTTGLTSLSAACTCRF